MAFVSLYKDRVDGIVAFHNAKVDGKMSVVRVVVGEDADGNLFYNINLDRGALAARGSSVNAVAKLSRANTSINTVTEAEININVLFSGARAIALKLT